MTDNLNSTSNTYPVRCLTATISTTPQSLADFGFTQKQIESAYRAYIQSQDGVLFCKWAPESTEEATGIRTADNGKKTLPAYEIPVPAVNDGHQVAVGAERQVSGSVALWHLRMVAGSPTVVTITLEG